MPPVSHPFKKGALTVLMNFNDHAPPHVHIRYRNDVKSYRYEIKAKKWMKPGKNLPPKLKKMVEAWIDVHEKELLEQWENAVNNRQIKIVG